MVAVAVIELTAAFLIFILAMLAMVFWFADGTPLFEIFPDARVALTIMSLVYIGTAILLVRGKQWLERRLGVEEKLATWLTYGSAVIVTFGFAPTFIVLLRAFTTG